MHVYMHVYITCWELAAEIPDLGELSRGVPAQSGAQKEYSIIYARSRPRLIPIYCMVLTT